MTDHPVVAWLSAIIVFCIYYPWVPIVLALFLSAVAWCLFEVNRRD